MNDVQIAIVGDANKARLPALAKKVAEELGAELAHRGCRILVFSSDPAFVECDVVHGYRNSKSTKPRGAIEVRYPPDLHGLFPGEEPGDPLFKRRPLGREWEASFYPSLAEVGGLILIGGGYTSKVAGLVAIGARTPLLPLGGLGGTAKDVLDSLRADRRSIATESDLDLMAQTTWTEQSAARCVDTLIEQNKRRQLLDTQAVELESEQRRVSMLSRLALVGTGLFVAVLLAIAEAWHSEELTRGFLLLLFGAPAIAGASGAVIRVVWDQWRPDAVLISPRPIGMTIALGFWASGVAGALFLLPQVVAMGSLRFTEAARLLPFAAVTGLIAGVTLDKVFPKLTKVDVPLTGHTVNANPGVAGQP